MNKTRKTGAKRKPADKMRNLIVTVSDGIADHLTGNEIRKAFMAVLGKMQRPNPKGNQWEFETAGHKIRAILNKDYVLRGEDVVWLSLSKEEPVEHQGTTNQRKSQKTRRR
ncbi:hypothetical protein FJY63_00060 [Candidatus Sumerlaeota bacterium]|nr:hypothetical protein [Candidatus Sumerlaeota bacterium]